MTERNLEEKQILSDVTIIGAGLSGATLARELSDSGFKVALIDKARGSGGRFSSKRISDSHTDTLYSFDLGCAQLQEGRALFTHALADWANNKILERLKDSANVISPDMSRGQALYVATPRSSALTRHLIDGVDTHFSSKVSKIDYVDGQWECFCDRGERVATSTKLVLAIPPQQVQLLIDQTCDKWDLIDSARMHPQWVVLMVLPKHVDISAGLLNDVAPGSTAKVICDSNKPQRQTHETSSCWVIQMSVDWSHKNLDLPKEQIVEKVSDLVKDATDPATDVIVSYAHRWLYSQVKTPLIADQGVLVLAEGLFACGDWVISEDDDFDSPNGAEAAFLSAIRLSMHLKQSLNV